MPGPLTTDITKFSTQYSKDKYFSLGRESKTKRGKKICDHPFDGKVSSALIF